MPVDARTAYMMAGLVCLFSALTLAVMRESHPPSRHALDAFAAAMCSAGAAMLAGATHDLAPAWLSGWFAMSCAGGAFALIYEGARRLYRGSSTMPVTLGAVGFLSLVLAVLPEFSSMAILLLSFEVAYATAGLRAAIQGEDRPANRARWALMLMFASIALSAVARLATVVLAAEPVTEATRRYSGIQGAVILLFMLLPMLLVSATLAIASARQLADLSYQASTDELTGAASRRFLFASAERWLTAATSTSAHTALMMIDIDHFKSVNDRHGHVVGDRVLRHVACVLRTSLRENALVARYGGEEFCALVPVDDERQARAVAERLRRSVEVNVYHEDDLQVPVTVSIGMALHRAGYTLQDVLHAADRRVYQAKTDGRNRTVCDEPQFELAVV